MRNKRKVNKKKIFVIFLVLFLVVVCILYFYKSSKSNYESNKRNIYSVFNDEPETYNASASSSGELNKGYEL